MNVAIRERAESILRDHFDFEASDAGLRSLDLAGVGGGSRSPDASAVARADRGKARGHARVRETLKRLQPRHVELLSLAYGVRLRDRDTEDGKYRKAVRRNERGWRVRLAELYGASGAVVLASPLARKLYGKDVDAILEADTTFIAWLLANVDLAPKVKQDARRRLDEALDAFALEHGIVDIPAEPRTRSSDKTRARILAFHNVSGHEFGE